MNTVQVVGRIGRDAEIRYTPGGAAVADVALAIDMGKDKSGEKRPALWVKVVLWNKQAESLAQYLTKGKQIAVAGRLSEPEAWTGREDSKAKARVVIQAGNITLLGGGERTEEKGEAAPRPEIGDDDIPF